QEKIGDLSGFLSPEVRLAYLPGPSGVRLRLTVMGRAREEVRSRLDGFERRLRHRVEAFIYGSGDVTLEEVVGKMLVERGLTVAVAESCTGGCVANRITNVPGSSTYMLGGVVAYSNWVKIGLLGVVAEVLETEGAVSESVARHMAEGVRRHLKADIGLSTTGVAGPTGGTVDKPVGTVWIAYSDEQGTDAVLLNLVDDRILNKELTATALLNYVRRRLAEGPAPQ
ncbi:MAG: nicotinamide-nucleotide amidohydrolase family protein, partial [Rhodothermales bacterium]